MTKFYSFFTAVIFAAAVNAQATEVVNENFNYFGALSANGWTTHSGTAGQLTANGALAKLVAGNTEDVNKTFSTPYAIAADKINVTTYSATLNIASAAGLSKTGDYFLMLSSATGTTGVTTFYARVFAKGTETGYTLGILNNSGNPVTPTYGIEIPYNTPTNIVVTYTIDNTAATPIDVATLQISGQPLLTNSSGTGGIPVVLSSIALRQAGTATSGTGTVYLADIVVTTLSSTLAVVDANATKTNLVKNTVVGNNIMFAIEAEVQILNMNGQVVRTATVNENTSLDVASLAKGMYVITANVNGKAVSQKVIKK